MRRRHRGTKCRDFLESLGQHLPAGNHCQTAPSRLCLARSPAGYSHCRRQSSPKPAEQAALLEVLVIRLQLPTHPSISERVAAIREQLDLLPPKQPCLFNVVANLKPVIAFNLDRLAENSGETSLAASAFRDGIELALERSSRYLFHLARAHLAGIQAALGQLHTAHQTCEQGLAEDAVLKTSPFLALLHAQMGILLYEWNDMPTAGQHFTNGLALALTLAVLCVVVASRASASIRDAGPGFHGRFHERLLAHLSFVERPLDACRDLRTYAADPRQLTYLLGRPRLPSGKGVLSLMNTLLNGKNSSGEW